MKLTILVLVLLSAYVCRAQHSEGDILGKWINIPKENTIIEVYKINDEYKGKIVWTKDNDKKKPVNFVILEKLKYNAETMTWEDGRIHDPNSGSTYSASAKIESDGILKVHGYIGFKFLGTTKNFRKVN